MESTSVLTVDDVPGVLPGAPARALLRRYFLRSVALLCALGAAVVAVAEASAGLWQRAPAAVLFALATAGGLAALRFDEERQQRALAAVAAVAMAAAGCAAWGLGWGLGAPATSIFVLVVCLTRTATGTRLGAAVAAAALAVLLALAFAEHGGVVAPGPMPLWLRTATHVLAVAAALAAGELLGRLVVNHALRAGERELRFRSLLGIATDAYWETDRELRLRSVSRRAADSEFQPWRPWPPGQRGPLPWELPGLAIDDETLDLLRAEMESRNRFRDLPLRWTSAAGQVHHLLVSGEPRVGQAGKLRGYWGVVHDVTVDVKAREALLATERRYHELFNRMPTPLVLMREGRIIDGNPAAARLLGVAGIELLLDQPLQRWYEPGESLRRAQAQAARLETLPSGQTLPLEEFRLLAGHRRLTVRGSGVRVDADGGPATLFYYLDDTERNTAQTAMRRSQELLARVVAMSPDVITLTDMHSGRYEMVNASFVRVYGWLASEVVGRTAAEIGIWHRPEARERLVQRLQEQDAVHDMAVEFVARDGRVLPMNVSATRFELEGRPYLVINARDVSDVERSRLEREAILENAFIGIALTRGDQIVVANPRLEQMFGWPRGGLVGQDVGAIWPTRARHGEPGAQALPRLGHGEPVEIEGPMTRRDGSSFEGRILGKAVDPSHPARGGTIWIAEDITDRRAVERALARTHDEAQAANRAKSDFLANTSHEIRTPLNGLVGLARLARDPALDDARRRLYLDQIADSAQALSVIISDILDLSKIEAGKLALEMLAFDLHELLQSLETAYAAMAEAGGLHFELQVEDDVPAFVSGDPVRVRQILSNYLANALKFTPEGAVRLRACAGAPGRVRFEVHDSGPGIDGPTQARLFQPFVQADASTTRRFGGTGLGLSICRELAHLMGGEVGVHSEPGRGSVFWAELPLAVAPADERDSGFGVLDVDPLLGAHLLVVEDNAVNMMIAVAMLQQWGARVGQAVDGPTALQAVEDAAAAGDPYDLVLMDVQMPEMSGHEATRRLRERWGAEALPVVALTAAALVSEREQAIAIGMNDFVTKPIDARRLRATLTRLLAARQAP